MEIALSQFNHKARIYFAFISSKKRHFPHSSFPHTRFFLSTSLSLYISSCTHAYMHITFSNSISLLSLLFLTFSATLPLFSVGITRLALRISPLCLSFINFSVVFQHHTLHTTHLILPVMLTFPAVIAFLSTLIIRHGIFLTEFN